MFDDQPNTQNIPPANLPTEPVDMFADAEKNSEADTPVEQPPNALSAGLLKKKDDVPMPPPQVEMDAGAINPAPMYAMKEPILGKIILAVVFIAILGGLGFGGWWIYTNYFSQPITTAPNNVVENQVPVVTPGQEENVVPVVIPENVEVVPEATATIPTDVELNRDINNDRILFGEPIDTDKDGLDDVRETEIGTDPLVADTDKDGLIDGDEVIIWKTDPLNPDTDGDTYLDGSEVFNGYNPLGPGKLFNPQTSTSTK